MNERNTGILKSFGWSIVIGIIVSIILGMIMYFAALMFLSSIDISSPHAAAQSGKDAAVNMMIVMSIAGLFLGVASIYYTFGTCYDYGTGDCIERANKSCEKWKDDNNRQYFDPSVKSSEKKDE